METATTRVMQVLAGDSLRGRGNYQPGARMAAEYIQQYFQRLGLQVLPGQPSYLLRFDARRSGARVRPDRLELNGRKVSDRRFRFFHRRPGSYPVITLDDFESWTGAELTPELLMEIGDSSKPLLIILRPQGKKSPGIDRYPFLFPPDGLRRDVLVLVSDVEEPSSLELKPIPGAYERLAWNVCGMLPAGRADAAAAASTSSTSSDARLISAHYDHLGSEGDHAGDAIFNGANDNASGTTAMLLTASILSRRPAPARPVIFCAFAAEELGLLGSADFVKTIGTVGIGGNMNLEMLAIPQFGRKTLMITGEGKSKVPARWRASMQQRGIAFIRDPVPEQQLFERSDNYRFFLQGIPAHTLMASTDADPCYHRPCDKLDRADLQNLAQLIDAIADAVWEWSNEE